jgi:multidrug resistance efflux pump
MNKKKVVPVLLLVIVSVSVFYYSNSSKAQENGNIVANGTLEFTEVAVSTEIGGKIEELLIEEGDNISKKQLMAVINPDILKAQLTQAQANLQANKAKLAGVIAGARQEEIAQAKAAVNQSESLLSGAKKSWINARDIYQNRANTKQMLDNAQTQNKLAKSQFQAAKANMEQVRASLENAESNYKRMQSLYAQESVTRQQLETAQTQYEVLINQLKSSESALNQAKTAMSGAEINFTDVNAIYENRIPQKQQVDNALTQFEVAGTNVEIARKRLDLLLASAKKEDIDVLRAGVSQAEAARQLAEIQLSRSKIFSPEKGVVLLKNVEAGENVAPGSVIATIADINQIWLNLYIPETQIGLVKLGQKVDVKVDSFPETGFSGKIQRISSRAEFTPRNVQTKEERVNQVFAVKVLIPNPQGKLKAGMPADAEIVKGEN